MRKEIHSKSLMILVLLATCAVSVTGCAVAPVYQPVQVSAPMEQEAYAPEEAPPPLDLAAPPDVVVVPSGDISIYMVPNMTGVYFYEGTWYRNYGGLWYSASDYNASWGVVGVGFVPQVVINVPPEYPRYLPADYHRVHYNEFRGNWRSWDRERHWQKQDWYRRESLADTRRDRMNRIERERASRPAERRQRKQELRQDRKQDRQELRQDIKQDRQQNRQQKQELRQDRKQERQDLRQEKKQDRQQMQQQKQEMRQERKQERPQQQMQKPQQQMQRPQQQMQRPQQQMQRPQQQMQRPQQQMQRPQAQPKPQPKPALHKKNEK